MEFWSGVAPSEQLNFSRLLAAWLLFRSAIEQQTRYQIHTKTEKGRAFYSASEPRSLSGAPENLDLSSWYDRLLYDAERSGLRLNKAAIDSEMGEVILEIENASYALTADAVHKVLSLSEVHLSRKIKSVKVALREQDQRAPTIRYRRQQPQATKKNLVTAPRRKAYQLYAKLSARVSIAPHLNLWGVYGQDIYNDFTIDRVSNSRIQKVRSDVNYYLTEGESGIDQLFL